jgi:hypothetical protein
LVGFTLSWLLYAIHLPVMELEVVELKQNDWRSIIMGLLTFTLLFLQLRIIDDLDDLEDDCKDHEGKNQIRRYFLLLLCVIPLLLLGLNWVSPMASMMATLATILSYLGPFVIKHYLHPKPIHLIIAWFIFEGAPASFFLYAYFAWMDAANIKQIHVSALLATLATFWIGYQFWKFSRKIHLDAFQPYYLSKAAIQWVLTALILLAMMMHSVIYLIFSLSMAYISYALFISFIFLVAIQMNIRPRHAPWWSGMTYMMLVEIGLVLEML